MKEKIPKKIHFVWVGDQEKSELIQKCIESWKKYLPEYEIIEWGNDALKDIDNRYCVEACQNNKWAFVSDYLRLYALYNFGGIYLDSDVRVTSVLDQFLEHEFFSGYEYLNGEAFPITAVMGAKKGNEIIKELLNEYDNLSFMNSRGEMDQETNTRRISRFFKQKFNLHPPYNHQNHTILTEGAVLYPSSYFCTPEEGKNNYAIHLFNGSWVDGFLRRDKFHFGKYSILRFKREHFRNNSLPLGLQEKILFSWKLNSKKFYSCIKRD